MLKIGLTGSIGSGKTLVSKVFEVLNVPVYHADEAGRRLMGSAPVIYAVQHLFGGSVISSDGNIDRKALADIVFNDRGALEKLNAIIHPLVIADFRCWADLHHHLPYIIQEAAIIIESGLQTEFDFLIMVTAPEEIRIQRVQKRDNVSRENVVARIKSQLPEEEKLKYSDYQIVNDGVKMIIPQVLDVHNKILAVI